MADLKVRQKVGKWAVESVDWRAEKRDLKGLQMAG